MEHDTLRILSRAGDAMPWVLKRGDERWEGIPPGRATTNSPELLMRMALQGAGITMVTDHFALPYLQRGELVEVLPDWHLPPVNAWAVFPGRRLMPARTRVFLDALAEKFTGPGQQLVELGVIDPTQTNLHKANIQTGLSDPRIGYTIRQADIQSGPNVTVATCPNSDATHFCDPDETDTNTVTVSVTGPDVCQ